jgi:glutathione S-transferase
MLKIWGRTNSINVQKVMWTVAELGLPHEHINAGMAHGVVTEPWYGDINPNRLVPVIDDDGVVLWESNVIVRYLSHKHASGTLMPSDPVQRAKAEMWMDWQQTSLLGFGPMFMNLIRYAPDKRDAAAIKSGQESTAAGLALVDAWLKGRTFMMGDQFTIADIPLGCVAYRWYGLPIERPELPNFRAWYERLMARAAYKQHVMLPIT